MTDLIPLITISYFLKPPSTSEGDHYQDSPEVRREQRVLGAVSLILGRHSFTAESMPQREERRREDGPAPQSLKFSGITRYELLWNQGYKVWPGLISNSCWDLRIHTGRWKGQLQSLLLVKDDFRRAGQGRASGYESRRNFHYGAAKRDDRTAWQDP